MTDLKDKIVLVTGATGYLGSALCRRLAEAGARVHGLSRHLSAGSTGNLCFWQGDLAEPGTAAQIVREVQPEYIFHLAGLADGRRDRDLVGPTFAVNAAATVEMLEAACRCGCRRFVYAASMEEPDPADPCPQATSPYAASKWTGTAYTVMYHRLYELAAVPLRVFLTYGPGFQDRHKLIPHIVTSLLRGEPPRLSSGVRELDVVFIEDVIDAFLAATENRTVLGRVIPVGSGQRVTIREIADRIADIVDNGVRPAFGALPDRPFEVSPTADLRRAESMLGWQPTTSLADGLRKTVQWYREQQACGRL